jgi:ATP-dependent exoDNAse (exonuclease V) beta subunit
VQTVSEWAASLAPLDVAGDLPPVSLVEVPGRQARPGGRRYGTLVHAVLATVPLDASRPTIGDLAGALGRALGATGEEVRSAIEVAEAALREPLLARARQAMTTGRCRRETPVALTLNTGVLVEGVVDLAFDEADGVTIVDFKTDRDLERGLAHYTRQLQLYAVAIRSATGRSATPVLMRI